MKKTFFLCPLNLAIRAIQWHFMSVRKDLGFSTYWIFKIWNLYFRWGFRFFYIFEIAKKLVCYNDKSTWSLSVFCCLCVLRCSPCQWEAVILFMAFKVWSPVLISCYTPLWKSSCSWLKSCFLLWKSQLAKGIGSCYLIENWAPCSTHAMFLDGWSLLSGYLVVFINWTMFLLWFLLSLVKVWAPTMECDQWLLIMSDLLKRIKKKLYW